MFWQKSCESDESATYYAINNTIKTRCVCPLPILISKLRNMQEIRNKTDTDEEFFLALTVKWTDVHFATCENFFIYKARHGETVLQPAWNVFLQHIK